MRDRTTWHVHPKVTHPKTCVAALGNSFKGLTDMALAHPFQILSIRLWSPLGFLPSPHSVIGNPISGATIVRSVNTQDGAICAVDTT